MSGSIFDHTDPETPEEEAARLERNEALRAQERIKEAIYSQHEAEFYYMLLRGARIDGNIRPNMYEFTYLPKIAALHAQRSRELMGIRESDYAY